MTLPRIEELDSLGFEWIRTSPSSRVGSKNMERVEAVGEALIDETDLGGSPSKLAAKPRIYSATQAAMSLSQTSQHQRVISWCQTLESMRCRRNYRCQHTSRKVSTRFPMPPSWLQASPKVTF
jgi:hypothetical protein